MDREQLIEQVNAETAGNRHDYLTRRDVEQIVDATLRNLEPRAEEPAPEAPPAGTPDDGA